MHEVVITGIGLRTPMGHTLEAVKQVFASGRPVVRLVPGPGGRQRAFAKMQDDASAGFSRFDQLLLDPVAQLAQLASEDALADSGLLLEYADRDRIGVYLGTGQGPSATAYENFTQLATQDTIKSFSVLRGLGNGAASQVAIRHGLRGACDTLVLACSSSNSALGNAMRAIRHGYLDAALAGGAEATFNEGAIRSWEALRVLASVDPARPEAGCKPFAKDRSGMVLGDGAVIYLLEAAEHAHARGARIYARLAGYGASADAVSLAQPDAAGQALALQACLRDAGLAPADIGYINAHGTATPAADPVEVQALKAVFGAQADQIPISATKSLHGHLLGAAGAVELLAAIVALTDGLIAPTANLEQPDPDCDLDFVPLQARRGVEVNAALSSSFAMGGSNTCLAVTRA